MNAEEQINGFKEFLERNYKAELSEKVRRGEKFLVVDFSELSKFDPELADELLEEPEDIIRAAELAIEEFDLQGDIKGFKIRFSNLPESQKIMIRNIRSKHINKLGVMEGVVRLKSDVRPQVTSARFECPACGNVTNVLQVDSGFKEPTTCSCGRRGKFKLLSKVLVDAQRIVLEESPEQLEGGEQPKRISVFLQDDLVSPLSEKRTNPGSNILVVGIVKEVPIILRTGIKSTRYDLAVEANNVRAIDESFYEVDISEEEEKQIQELAKDPKIYGRLINSIAPSIFGYDTIKEALILQMVGGVQKKRKDGSVTRGDMHVLLIGDPGSGKSQILKRISHIAPKGRFVSGKGVSGAGLTASVVKDEFLRGWSLEAGALVLASNGICCIDEIDKMTPEDRAAMHEALEGQSYHPNVEIMLSDGTTAKIGELVDNLMKTNEPVKGVNTEFLFPNDVRVLTTDFNKVYAADIQRISRHPAPGHFIEVSYSNGRKITVTPEHPLFVFFEGRIKEIPASSASKGMFAPAPRNIPTNPRKIMLKKAYACSPRNKKILFPEFVDKDFAKLLGYITSEGHCYYNRKTRYAEIGVSNTDKAIADEVEELFGKVFSAKVNINIQKKENREKATKDLITVRCCSIPLYKFFEENFPELINKAREKRAPNAIKAGDKEAQKAFLQGLFKGDGFVDSSDFGFSTSSYEGAKDYQDLLLQQGIWNFIRKDARKEGTYYKIVVSGKEDKLRFNNDIVMDDDLRKKRISKYCLVSKQKLNQRDPIPTEILVKVKRLLNKLGLDTGYYYSIIKNNQNSTREVVLSHLNKIRTKTEKIRERLGSAEAREIRKNAVIFAGEIAGEINSSSSTVYNIERRQHGLQYSRMLDTVKNKAIEKLDSIEDELRQLYMLVDSEIRFVTITDVKAVPNKDAAMVYDVTVAPNQTFISQGLVLHNTVTISKANIQATLLARTTVLAAANPKFGRFDPYGVIADQIDLPPTLINRFDLIFPIKDLPDEKKDKEMAGHILNLHQSPDMFEPEIPTALLKKYVAYARQKIHPVLTDAAAEEIKTFYVEMRMSGSTEGSIKTIPISPRQLEALVRLSEASAKIRLADKVGKKDARKAIELLRYCLEQIGLDKETGKIDIDRIATGIAASERSHIMTIKDIVTELENKVKPVPIDDILMEAASRDIAEEKVEEILEKLKRSGDIFEPKRGFIQKI